MWFCNDLNKKFSFEKGQYFWSLVDEPLVETTAKESHELIYFLTHHRGGCVEATMGAGDQLEVHYGGPVFLSLLQPLYQKFW